MAPADEDFLLLSGEESAWCPVGVEVAGLEVGPFVFDADDDDLCEVEEEELPAVGNGRRGASSSCLHIVSNV